MNYKKIFMLVMMNVAYGNAMIHGTSAAVDRQNNKASVDVQNEAISTKEIGADTKSLQDQKKLNQTVRVEQEQNLPEIIQRKIEEVKHSAQAVIESDKEYKKGIYQGLVQEQAADKEYSLEQDEQYLEPKIQQDKSYVQANYGQYIDYAKANKAGGVQYAKADVGQDLGYVKADYGQDVKYEIAGQAQDYAYEHGIDPLVTHETFFTDAEQAKCTVGGGKCTGTSYSSQGTCCTGYQCESTPYVLASNGQAGKCFDSSTDAACGKTKAVCAGGGSSNAQGSCCAGDVCGTTSYNIPAATNQWGTCYAKSTTTNCTFEDNCSCGCYLGFCASCSGPDGMPCGGNSQCSSGNCYMGLCEACIADGFLCSDDGNCCDSDCYKGVCGGEQYYDYWIEGAEVAAMMVATVAIAVFAPEFLEVVLPEDEVLIAGDVAEVGVDAVDAGAESAEAGMSGGNATVNVLGFEVGEVSVEVGQAMKNAYVVLQQVLLAATIGYTGYGGYQVYEDPTLENIIMFVIMTAMMIVPVAGEYFVFDDIEGKALTEEVIDETVDTTAATSTSKNYSIKFAGAEIGAVSMDATVSKVIGYTVTMLEAVVGAAMLGYLEYSLLETFEYQEWEAGLIFMAELVGMAIGMEAMKPDGFTSYDYDEDYNVITKTTTKDKYGNVLETTSKSPYDDSGTTITDRYYTKNDKGEKVPSKNKVKTITKNQDGKVLETQTYGYDGEGKQTRTRTDQYYTKNTEGEKVPSTTKIKTTIKNYVRMGR